jgi:hypothetical protein
MNEIRDIDKLKRGRWTRDGIESFLLTMERHSKLPGELLPIIWMESLQIHGLRKEVFMAPKDSPINCFFAPLLASSHVRDY